MIIEEFEQLIKKSNQTPPPQVDVEIKPMKELDSTTIRSNYSSFEEALVNEYHKEGIVNDYWTLKLIKSISQEYVKTFDPFLPNLISALGSYFHYLQPMPGKRTQGNYQSFYESFGEDYTPKSWSLMNDLLYKCSKWENEKVKYSSKIEFNDSYSPAFEKKCIEVATKWFDLESLKRLKSGGLRFSVLIRSNETHSFYTSGRYNNLIYHHELLQHRSGKK